MDIGTTLLVSILFGSIGAGYFLYGKRQHQVVPLLTGIALCVYPYFLSNGYAIVAVGILLTAVPWLIRRFPLLLLTGAMLCVALSAVQAEIIKRVNPDGTVTYTVPQKVPSGIRPGPCGVNVEDILTLQTAQETYATLLDTLRLDPGNVACRQALALVGRRAGLSERVIANDLNASTSGGGALPLPGPSELTPNTGTAQ